MYGLVSLIRRQWSYKFLVYGRESLCSHCHYMLCVCLSTIDHCGDHLLECSHGPMHIHRHDLIVDFVYHALCQSHPGVL